MAATNNGKMCAVTCSTLVWIAVGLPDKCWKKSVDHNVLRTTLRHLRYVPYVPVTYYIRTLHTYWRYQ
jgi:hypothetical protein